MTEVDLRPVTLADYEFIYGLETGADTLALYRHRGVTPSPEDFVRGLWAGVFAQFVVVSRQTRRPLGLVAAYDADHRNQRASIAVISAEGRVGPASRVLLGAELLIDYLFAEFNLRKICAQVLGPNMRYWDNAIRQFGRIEGRLHEHEFVGGRWEDTVLVAIDRTTWKAARSLTGVVVPSVGLDVDSRRAEQIFLEQLAEILERDVAVLCPSDGASVLLVDDLRIDSLQFVMVLELITSWRGSELPDQMIDALDSVAMAVHFALT
jgi:acyl carrier protein